MQMSDEKEKSPTDVEEAQLRGRDIGAAVGKFVTGGSKVGTTLGYVAGKASEGRPLLAIREQAPPPPRREITDIIKEKLSSAWSNLWSRQK